MRLAVRGEPATRVSGRDGYFGKRSTRRDFGLRTARWLLAESQTSDLTQLSHGKVAGLSQRTSTIRRASSSSANSRSGGRPRRPPRPP